MNRVQVFGHGDAEVKIYPIKRKGTPYRFFQIAWYELGGRRTKTFADPLKAKSYAQQAHVSLLNQGRIENVTPQDIQMFRDAERSPLRSESRFRLPSENGPMPGSCSAPVSSAPQNRWWMRSTV